MAKINTTFSFKDEVSQGLAGLDANLKNINATLLVMADKMGKASDKIRNTGNESEKAYKKLSQLFTKLINFNQVAMVFGTVKRGIDLVSQSIAECSNLYNFQIEQETKLEQVMRKHMKASAEQIQMIKNVASDQQKKGIYGDEMQLAGLQELATYVEDAETLKELAPILNSMVAQSLGTNATDRDMLSYATMLGKVMQGQVGGMSKRGYKFTEEEEQILKTGTEMQKLAVLQQAVIGNFGDMNEALRQTPQGQIIALNNDIGDLKENIGQTMIPFNQMFQIATSQWRMRWLTLINDGLKWMMNHVVGVKIALMGVGVAIASVVTAYAFYHKAQIMAIGLHLKELAILVAKWAVEHAEMLLIIGGILAVIAAIGVMLAYSEKTFPFIGGLIGGVGGVAKETAALIKYGFGTAIEGVVNGFRSMKDKVCDFFLLMVNKILELVEKIAPAIDFVFKTNLTNEIAEARKSIETLKNELPEKFSLGWTDDRKGFGNAWKEGKLAGAEAGANLSDKWQGWLNGKINEVKGMTKGDMSDAISDTFNFSGESLDVSDKNLINIADDYRDLLSKRATERFNLQYKSVTPSVNIGSMNVNNGVDAETIINEIDYKLREATNSNLGVA